MPCEEHEKGKAVSLRTCMLIMRASVRVIGSLDGLSVRAHRISTYLFRVDLEA